MFEISLVPDVKAQALKVQRIRNIIFIICVITMIVFGVIVSALWGIKIAQDVTMGGQDTTLNLMSEKINGFSELNDFLTIQNQLNNLETINGGRIDVSRVFALFDVLVPTNGDEITFSEVHIDPVKNTIQFDAQADANAPNELDIDYRVLEAFIKSMPLMRFDYGVYKNKNDFEIPSVCILETDEDGNLLKDEESGNYYVIWTKDVNGCDPEGKGELVVRDKDEDSEMNGDSGMNDNDNDNDNEIVEGEEYYKPEVVNIEREDVENARNRLLVDTLDGNNIEDYEDEKINVKIWRTPKLKELYGRDGEYIDSNGNISNIEHFESRCVKYSLKDSSNISVGRWVTENQCNLVPEKLNVTSSSNGRDSSSKLVLKFSAVLTYNPEAFLARNKHILFSGPTGYTNVTDSVRQIESFFKEEAMDCTEYDVDCLVNNNDGKADKNEY